MKMICGIASTKRVQCFYLSGRQHKKTEVSMKLSLLLGSLMTMLSSANALAADANVTFNGTVSANTCTLAAADATKVLTIPNVAAATLYAAGITSYVTYNASGSFAFSACPAGLTKVTSSYTYQGTVASGNANVGVATGSATNVGFVVMQTATASTTTIVAPNGTSGTLNQATIASNSATVPVIVGIVPTSSAGIVTMPTLGNYTGTYLVAFTYS